MYLIHFFAKLFARIQKLSLAAEENGWEKRKSYSMEHKLMAIKQHNAIKAENPELSIKKIAKMIRIPSNQSDKKTSVSHTMLGRWTNGVDLKSDLNLIL